MTSTLPHRTLPAIGCPPSPPHCCPLKPLLSLQAPRFLQTQGPGRLLGCCSATVWLFVPTGCTVHPRWAFWLPPAFNPWATALLLLSPHQNKPPVPQVAEYQDRTRHPCGYLQALEGRTMLLNSKHCPCLQNPGSGVASRGNCARQELTGNPSLQPLFPLQMKH